MNKLDLLKAIVLSLAVSGMLAGCGPTQQPQQDPVGVIDIVPGQPSIIQPPATEPVAPQGPAERSI